MWNPKVGLGKVAVAVEDGYFWLIPGAAAGHEHSAERRARCIPFSLNRRKTPPLALSCSSDLEHFPKLVDRRGEFHVYRMVKPMFQHFLRRMLNIPIWMSVDFSFAGQSRTVTPYPVREDFDNLGLLTATWSARFFVLQMMIAAYPLAHQVVRFLSPTTA